MKKIKIDDIEKTGRKYVEMYNPKYEKSIYDESISKINIPSIKWYQKKVTRNIFNISTSIIGGALLVIPQTRAIAMIAMSILPKKPKLLKSIFNYFKKGA